VALEAPEEFGFRDKYLRSLTVRHDGLSESVHLQFLQVAVERLNPISVFGPELLRLEIPKNSANFCQ